MINYTGPGKCMESWERERDQALLGIRITIDLSMETFKAQISLAEVFKVSKITTATNEFNQIIYNWKTEKKLFMTKAG